MNIKEIKSHLKLKIVIFKYVSLSKSPLKNMMDLKLHSKPIKQELKIEWWNENNRSKDEA